MAISVNILALVFFSEAQPRSKNGHPAHSTTGVVKINWSQLLSGRLTTSCIRAPNTMSPIASKNTGKPKPTPIQNRRVMSINSELGVSCTSIACGSSVIPHDGQVPGRVVTTSRCIGQMYLTPRVGSGATSGSSAMPHLGQGLGLSARTSGSIGQT